MRKILLIGELNQTVSSVNKHLSTRFQTQICKDDDDTVRGMLKVFEPELIVICMMGIGELNCNIFPLFKEEEKSLPILIVGSVEECNYYREYYEDMSYELAVRPTTLSVLMQKCLKLLRMSEYDMEAEFTAAQLSVHDKKRILAVDDSGVLLRSVKAILEKQYEVSVATSGKMAIRQAKKVHPDLILLDYEMPEWDGKKTLEEIRSDAELCLIPVVFLTAIADKPHIAAVLGMKPAGYLLKPIEPKKLIDTIEKAFKGEEPGEEE